MHQKSLGTTVLGTTKYTIY